MIPIPELSKCSWYVISFVVKFPNAMILVPRHHVSENISNGSLEASFQFTRFPFFRRYNPMNLLFIYVIKKI